MTKSENTEVFDRMIELSLELSSMDEVLYQHDPYQATVAAIILALDKKYSISTLETGSGKTFIIGLMY